MEKEKDVLTNVVWIAGAIDEKKEQEGGVELLTYGGEYWGYISEASIANEKAEDLAQMIACLLDSSSKVDKV